MSVLSSADGFLSPPVLNLSLKDYMGFHEKLTWTVRFQIRGELKDHKNHPTHYNSTLSQGAFCLEVIIS